MSVVLVLTLSLLFPALMLKMLSVIHRKWKLRLYWLIIPSCLILAMITPFLIYYRSSPNILFSLEAIIDYSVKTGLMIFLVIPSLLSGIICTLVGYLRPK